MSALAPTLQAFFITRLGHQRQASPRTVTSYRDAFRLLLGYARARSGKEPAQLDFTDLDATFVSGFLDHLEHERNNSARTRNARLAALRSFYRFASYRHPEHAELIAQVLAIPEKRSNATAMTFLNRREAEALLAAPDQTTWAGRRDHALLVVALQTGFRLSELTGLTSADVHLGTGAHVTCRGKGRKQRSTPLRREGAAVVRAWLRELTGEPSDPLFPSLHGSALSPDAVQRLVAKHVRRAQRACPSLAKKHVTPHTLRHTCAMTLLEAGNDVAVIGLFLGHEKLESTQIYLHGDMAIKERALGRTAALRGDPQRRYRPPDALLAFLEGL